MFQLPQDCQKKSFENLRNHAKVFPLSQIIVLPNLYYVTSVNLHLYLHGIVKLHVILKLHILRKTWELNLLKKVLKS